MLFTLDWTPIIAATVAAVPATLAAFIGILNRRQIRTPSGDTLGEIAERTHDMSAASNMMLNKINGDLHGKGAPDAETTPHD